VVRCSGEIGAYTAQPNFRIWEMLGALPRTRHSGEAQWYAVGRNWIRLAACKTVWPNR
jgi:hypothetical protein